MSYWTEVKELFLKGVDIALSGFKDTTEAAIEKGKEGVVSIQLKKDLFVAHRELQGHLADLGDAVNEIYKVKGDIYTDDKVKEAVDKISGVEARCRDIEKKMSEVLKKSA